jgi:hypothetical protein
MVGSYTDWKLKLKVGDKPESRSGTIPSKLVKKTSKATDHRHGGDDYRCWLEEKMKISDIMRRFALYPVIRQHSCSCLKSRVFVVRERRLPDGDQVDVVFNCCSVAAAYIFIRHVADEIIEITGGDLVYYGAPRTVNLYSAEMAECRNNAFSVAIKKATEKYEEKASKLRQTAAKR